MTDNKLMARARCLAEECRALTPPNPSVGCVIVSAQGQVLGQGHTQRVGQAHAEVMALRAAHAAGYNVRGATVYVTLEPCSHFGRTPPCCDALIETGVARVVVAQQDPNPLVAGQGIARLRAAGIAVEVLDPQDPAAVATRELNLGFFSRMIRKRPWVRSKMAASLDGKTALKNGVSQWITSELARSDGHAWRARAGAVLTGIGSVLADNPRLDVRLPGSVRQPALVLLDSQLQTPLDAQLFSVERPLYIYTASADAARRNALQAKGAKVIFLPAGAGASNGKVDLPAMLADLGEREINELHVEAGATLNSALIELDLIDEFLVYLAPKLIGQGRNMNYLGPLSELSKAVALEFISTTMIGPDLRLLARRPGHSNF